MAAGVAGAGAAAAYSKLCSRKGKDGAVTRSRVPLVVPERAHGRDQAAAIRAIPGKVHRRDLLVNAVLACWAVNRVSQGADFARAGAGMQRMKNRRQDMHAQSIWLPIKQP